MDPETFPSVRSSALPTKDQSAKFLAEALDFFRIVRCTKALRKVEKCFFFLFLRFNTFLNQFNQHAIGT